MTCIVGIAQDSKVYIGADSAGSNGICIRQRADPKVFQNGEFLIGFTSSFRMGQILQYEMKPPKRHADQDVFEFMVCDFVAAVRESLKAGGFASKKEETEAGGSFLVGYQGRLFQIEDDYQVGENQLGYDACGSGEQVAMGSLFSTVNADLWLDRKTSSIPRHRILLALEAAEQFDCGVRGPFLTLSIGEENG